MSRKDFVLIAKAIEALSLSPETRVRVAREFADELSHTNARFNRARFLKACGVEVE